jgi:hypothetical protein
MLRKKTLNERELPIVTMAGPLYGYGRSAGGECIFDDPGTCGPEFME